MDFKESVRTATRPILIFFMGVTSFYFLANGMGNEWINWWIRVFLSALAEWILERPILKIAGKA